MGAALALASRGRGLSYPNPSVGCVIVNGGRVVGRGWTQVGGRPHAEAMALDQAGEAARGATVYVTLEPCAHVSARGPACADLLVAGRPARVVAAMIDPDPRTAGDGIARLRAAGIDAGAGLRAAEAERQVAGFLARQRLGRPFVTLKLATSLDGRIALADGRSRWITGDVARAHVHLERSRHEAILVGRGTWDADAPSLDVRLPGLESRSPVRVVLSHSLQSPFVSSEVETRPGSERSFLDFARNERGREEPIVISSPEQISDLSADHLFVEGGAQTSAAFLRADLVDRLLLYRAPILIGDGRPAIGDIGLADLADAHGRWQLLDARMLGRDRLEDYLRQR
jgi:diaminohydroxyphosphoribosylaminopyrimidine deaminase/5-amino-6-(5-phosphoribosylamino)uracil reductase